jgi:hypothetical protein
MKTLRAIADSYGQPIHKLNYITRLIFRGITIDEVLKRNLSIPEQMILEVFAFYGNLNDKVPKEKIGRGKYYKFEDDIFLAVFKPRYSLDELSENEKQLIK